MLPRHQRIKQKLEALQEQGVIWGGLKIQVTYPWMGFFGERYGFIWDPALPPEEMNYAQARAFILGAQCAQAAESR